MKSLSLSCGNKQTKCAVYTKQPKSSRGPEEAVKLLAMAPKWSGSGTNCYGAIRKIIMSTCSQMSINV